MWWIYINDVITYWECKYITYKIEFLATTGNNPRKSDSSDLFGKSQPWNPPREGTCQVEIKICQIFRVITKVAKIQRRKEIRLQIFEKKLWVDSVHCIELDPCESVWNSIDFCILLTYLYGDALEKHSEASTGAEHSMVNKWCQIVDTSDITAMWAGCSSGAVVTFKAFLGLGWGYPKDHLFSVVSYAFNLVWQIGHVMSPINQRMLTGTYKEACFLLL